MAIDIEELIKKGPPTKAEIEAIQEKWGYGGILDENDLARYNEYFRERSTADRVSNVLRIAFPNCQWSMEGENYETLEWDEDNVLPKPTQAEIRRLVPMVQDILDQGEYIARRRQVMPPEPLLTRALWEWLVEGKEDLKNAVQARRLAIKKRFPKPEIKHWMVQSEDILQILPNSPKDLERTDLSEEEMWKFAFAQGIEGEDAEPLATTLAVSETKQPTVSDVDGSQ